MDDSQKNRCPKCGGVIGASASGSITQWVIGCTCRSTDTNAAGDVDDRSRELPVTEICSTCKKRINRGRQGSFTQWVFRSDICDCEVPQPMMAPVVTQEALVGTDSSSQLSDEDSDTPALDVDPSRFPVDRYTPLAILGSGAAGTVYLCNDRLLKKHVAIKTLSHLTRNDLVAFQREAKATSKLNHQNIVQILDFGATESGLPYMVLEFVEGTNLARIIQETGSIDLVTTLIIFSQVCDGLAEAHKHGIFHRDIKDTNILVSGFDQTENDQTPDLSVRIIDFGVAGFTQATDVQVTTAQGATLVGTPHFMAPDLAAGRQFDAKTEIYSVGCTIFSALTGTTPFTGETALEILNQHATLSAPTLAETRPDLDFPNDIEEIVRRCLAKNPDDRFNSIEELGNSLKGLLLLLDSGALVDENQGTELDTPDGNRILSQRTSATHEAAQRSSKGKSAIKRITWIAAASALVCLVAFGGYKAMTGTAESEKPQPPDTVASSGRIGPFTPFPTDSDALKQLANFKLLDFDGVPYFVSAETLRDEDFEEASHQPGVWGMYIIAQRSEDDSTGITGNGFKYLADYPLKHLKIDGTPLPPDAYKAIGNITTLTDIYLGNMSPTENDLVSLRSLPNLVSLDLANSRLSEKAIASLAGLPALKTLSLVGIRTLTPSALVTLSSAPHLETLNLSCTTLGAQNLQPLTKLTNLKELIINGSSVSDKSLADLAAMPLSSLHLNENPLTGEGFRQFGTNQSLAYLSVRNCPHLVSSTVLQLKKQLKKCEMFY